MENGSTRAESEHLHDVLDIYRENYAEVYPALYVSPWRRKHEVDVRNLDRILSALGTPSPRWLDLACGQAWHFSGFAGRARMLGLDVSEAQLVRARRAAPHAEFIRGDMAEARFDVGSFDLVSNFWAGYCYLRDRRRIADLFRRTVGWIAPGGALYVEVLLGSDLTSFNDSEYSRRTAFKVTPLVDDFSEWEYVDVGGRHRMTSPPLEDFLAVVSPSFASVEAVHDGGFMFHLIATGRRGSDH